MKNKSQRDLEKHWAEQSKKQTPAERLRFKAEKLRKKMERAQLAEKSRQEVPADHAVSEPRVEVSQKPAQQLGSSRAKSKPASGTIRKSKSKR